MKHVRQPAGSNLCGQACVAMLLGCDLRSASKLVGREGPTLATQLAKALRVGGLRIAGRSTVWRNQKLPPIAIMKIKFKRRDLAHWVLKRGNSVHDPRKRTALPFDSQLWADRRGRITSFLSVSGATRDKPRKR